MEASCKVIPLKTAMTAAYDVLSGEHIPEPMDGREEASLINKALCVLKEMEEEWEVDHYSIGIRDKIHLLAYYLGSLPRT
ncbi:MAG: hypothetical protein H6Q53_2223 [Deltaproteobacteria bacterium]|jgi:hypothetical protein|nr:hypothetical protein [Deltaproteobacteria bacterium]